ncbi:MAG TPA: COX15/CtaA family protein [Flavobacteriaceae bacterium]|nr:COX15/CtaA family protein [Flavobacteriaceae bacterium]
MKNIRNLTIASIIIVYIVILAGGTVRMTGSGMGCPDWPKCFGYLIPPTDRADIEWKNNHSYKKNQIIILNDSLIYANRNFISKDSIIRNNWANYTKHDYSKFNVYHTWIEYINRLIGALAGLSVLILFISSLRFIKKNKLITILAFLSLTGILFQAWLGKTVVDSNLLAGKITIHMLMAIIIVSILFILLSKLNAKESNLVFNRYISTLTFISLVFLIIQVFSGTEIRQFVDIEMLSNNYSNKNKWLINPPESFYFHRSFSIIIVIVNSLVFIKLKKMIVDSKIFKIIMILLFIQILTGIMMYYFSFPFSTQPIHLLISSLIIGFQVYFYVLLNNKKKYGIKN